MNSRDYWAEREAEQLKHYITDEAEYDKQLKQIYNNMLDGVQQQINAFYGKYAATEGITIAEAKKRVSKLDIAEYERKAKKYVRDKDFSDQANEEMRLYNLTMKVNRLEMLKANIGLELIAGHDELEKFMGGILKGRTEEELQRQAGILGKTVLHNAAKASAIVNSSFHNARFSDRIWMYQDVLRADLNRILQTGLIQGKNPRALTREIREKFNATRYNAERLMRTELARVQTEAQKQSFIRNGFDMYMFICNEHATKHGTCDICQGLNGKHFKVEKMMPGENAPPLHPHCRCSTAAWVDDKEYDAWLDFLANGGTTEEWDKSGKADWLKSKEKPTRADLEKQIADTKHRVFEIDSEIRDVNSKIHKHSTHDFDDIAKLKKSDISSRIKAINDKFADLDAISDRWYNRPERGTPEYEKWREWRKTIKFDEIMEEQLRLATEKAQLETMLRKFDRYEEWKQWTKDNPLSELKAQRDSLLIEQNRLNAALPTLQRRLVEVVVDDSAVGKAYKNISYDCKVILKGLIDNGVDYNPIQAHSKPQGIDQIIQNLSGGDKTRGSCASVGLAYIGQKGGFDVLDFRDGASRSFFATTFNLRQISKLPGVKTFSETARSSVTAGNKLLKQVEIGKEYYLCCGRHASIVRMTDNGTLQYLELQSANKSGWTDFDGNPRYTLKWRFGENKGYDVTDFMIDIDSLKDSDDLKALLGYINTAEENQRKGKHGTIK